MTHVASEGDHNSEHQQDSPLKESDDFQNEF